MDLDVHIEAEGKQVFPIICPKGSIIQVNGKLPRVILRLCYPGQKQTHTHAKYLITWGKRGGPKMRQIERWQDFEDLEEEENNDV
jgi:hypothetical protein